MVNCCETDGLLSCCFFSFGGSTGGGGIASAAVLSYSVSTDAVINEDVTLGTSVVFGAAFAMTAGDVIALGMLAVVLLFVNGVNSENE